MNVTCPECRSVFRVDPSKLPAAVVRARCAVCGGLITITPSSSVRDEFAPRATTERVAASQLPAAAGAAAYARSAAPANPFVPPAPAAPPQQPAPPAAPPAAFTTSAQPAATPFAAPSAPAPPAARPVAPPPMPRTEPPQARPAAGESAPPNLGAATAAALLGRVDAPASSGARAPAGAAPRAPSPARAAMPFVRPGTGGPAQPPAATGTTPFGVRATPPAGQGAPRRPINPFLANDPNAKARRLARALISDMITYFPEKREEGLRTGALKQLFEEEITKSYGEYVEQVGREFAESTPFFQEALNEILAGGRKLF